MLHHHPSYFQLQQLDESQASRSKSTPVPACHAGRMARGTGSLPTPSPPPPCPALAAAAFRELCPQAQEAVEEVFSWLLDSVSRCSQEDLQDQPEAIWSTYSAILSNWIAQWPVSVRKELEQYAITLEPNFYGPSAITDYLHEQYYLLLKHRTTR